MTSYHETAAASEKEKTQVALSSVLAAVFITAFKIIVGVMTLSLGILAEAAHSALDLVAAAVTFFAVRISGRKPDEKQMFGYGKVENLSALFETLLLLVTCAWIIYEAVQRLFFKSVEVQVSIWSFIVMATSIVVDVSRSRALMKAAKKHNSQALEADALHFSTDVWSSSVVIGGLILVSLGQFLSSRALLPESALVWFHRADAIAALGVSAIVIWVSYNLGRRTIAGLLDSAPQGLHDRIVEGVSAIPGLLKLRQVRIRPSGPSTFVDMILEVPRTANFEEAHDISVAAKEVVDRLVDRVDVMVHIDPVEVNSESVVEKVQSVAGRLGLGVHSIRVNHDQTHFDLEMHIEVPDSDTIYLAHERATQVEELLRRELGELGEISIHIEPRGDFESRHMVSLAEYEPIRRLIESLPLLVPGVSDPHTIRVYEEGERLSASFHCHIPPETTITETHKLTSELERLLYAGITGLDRVYIHAEPAEG